LEISVSNDIQKGMNMVGEVKKLIDAPSTWKILAAGIWFQAVFSIIARNFSLFTIGS
jgi:hypothetical protein